MTGLARNAGRNVGIDQIGPAEMLDQPVARREIDALLPFGGIDVWPCGSADGGCDRWHSRLLDLSFRCRYPVTSVRSRSTQRNSISFQPLRRLPDEAQIGVCLHVDLPLQESEVALPSMLDCSAARSGSRSGLREYSLLVKSQPANSSGRSLVSLAAICTASS